MRRWPRHPTNECLGFFVGLTWRRHADGPTVESAVGSIRADVRNRPPDTLGRQPPPWPRQIVPLDGGRWRKPWRARGAGGGGEQLGDRTGARHHRASAATTRPPPPETLSVSPTAVAGVARQPAPWTQRAPVGEHLLQPCDPAGRHAVRRTPRCDLWRPSWPLDTLPPCAWGGRKATRSTSGVGAIRRSRSLSVRPVAPLGGVRGGRSISSGGW